MKTILLTGATDGIGLESAKMFAKDGHRLILHGRNREKLIRVKALLSTFTNNIDIYVADFSTLSDVFKMSSEILTDIKSIDVLINNAGVFIEPHGNNLTADGIDVRFAVNTIAPYILTKKLLPLLLPNSRVINLCSAAQSPVNFEALQGAQLLTDSDAYAQSKLALMMWTLSMAKEHATGPIFIAVNPKSFLGSKMVKIAYGQSGYDLKIGAKILYKIALSPEFQSANGGYFDNDYHEFRSPHPFALNLNNQINLINILNHKSENKGK